MANYKEISIIDSHTGGEPTRIIVSGGPDLGSGSMAERKEIFKSRFDEIRSAVVNEPRGSDVIVGGLLCEPVNPQAAAGIIFFNNLGFLHMCGHGTIGLMVTLQHLGRIGPGRHLLETPVGDVYAELGDNKTVAVQNVESYRLHADLEVEVPGYGKVVGDVAWGGNWFFLVKNSKEDLRLENVEHLTRVTKQIRGALEEQGITGENGGWIDHIELFGEPHDPANHSRNFVLCPGGAYDRSPCGTGTSAKLACLADDGKLAAGETWRQESIVGSLFEASYEKASTDNRVIPTIRGTAHVCAESKLLLDEQDPFCMGIRSE